MRVCIASACQPLRIAEALGFSFSRTFSTSRALLARSSISELLNKQDSVDNVEVSGWIKTIRKQKKIAFLALTDGSSLDTLQAVLTPEQSEGLTHGAAVQLVGNWKSSTGRGQKNELLVSTLRLCGENDAENNPIQPKYQSQEFLRTVPHLRPRVTSNTLVLRLRSEVIASITQWFHTAGFIQCHTPVITSSDCEGAGEVFTIVGNDNSGKDVQPFFRTPKYLTVSAQLHLEALAQAADKVWTLSPTFRAEKSDTPRHLSEFYMLEAELCFMRTSSAVMDVVENMLRSISRDLQSSKLGEELIQAKATLSVSDVEDPMTGDELRERWSDLTAPAWPRITYDEALDILTKAHMTGDIHFSITPAYEDGLAAEHERYIASFVGQGSPVFVTQYPKAQKPFYMATVPDQPQLVDCFDLLVPSLCELVGGSLREHRLAQLQEAMIAKNISGLEWYQDLRRYGSVSHGGFGLGFDRLICYLAGVNSIRDVVSFPRYHGKADC